MKAKRTARWLSGSLALALSLQMGTANAFAAVLSDPAEIMTETSVMAADPAADPALSPEDQAKWDQQAAFLGQNGNRTSKYINVYDNQPKVILWTKGINPPTIGEPDSQLHPINDPTGTEKTYQTGYIPNQGWYDVNKNGGPDRNLCFAVAASNSLHWWLDQNADYIQRYIDRNPDDPTVKALVPYLNSFVSQSESRIFKYFIRQFANRTVGYWADLLQDHFINGYPYKPDQGEFPNDPNKDSLDPGNDPSGYSGFFMDVFGKTLLTQRLTITNYNRLSETIKRELMAGNMIMVTYRTTGIFSHVVTLWGAEYDLDGNICAVFLSDSDVYSDEENRSMLRYTTKNDDGAMRITTMANPDPKVGSMILSLNTLSLGTQYWQQYFGEVQTPLTLTWDSTTTFPYDGKSHAPTAKLPASVQGDVQIVIKGAATDAGKHTATAELTGNDAGKYTLTNATQEFEITPVTTSVILTEKKTGDKTYTLHAEVNGALPGEVLEGTVTFSDAGQDIASEPVTNGAAETTWTASDANVHTITATFTPANKNYSSSSNSITIDLSKKEQAELKIDPIGDKTFKTDTTFELSTTGGSTNKPVQYTSSNQSVITINGSTATIVGAGTTTITATMPGDDTYNDVSTTVDVTVNKAAAPEINFPTASGLTYGQKLSESALTGGSDDLGTFAWTNAETVPGAGTADYEVTFTPSALTEQNYDIPVKSRTGMVSVTVAQAAPAVVLNAAPDASGNVTLTTSISPVANGEIPKDGTVTFLYEKDGVYIQIPDVAPVPVQNGSAQSIWSNVAPGTYNVKAQFAGSVNYADTESTPIPVDTTKPAPQAHTVTVTTDGSGTASATPTLAVQGDTVTLTAAPAEGYTFKGWNVLAGGVTISADNSFTMPDMDVQIQAVFEKEETPQPPQPPVPPTPPQPPVPPTPPYIPPMPPQPNVPNIVTNPDGSTTQTVTQPDGSVVKETSKPDGSRVVEYTKNDGSTSVTHTAADGSTEAQVKIPERVTSEAAKNDQTVALPMPPVSVQNGRPSSVTVDLGTAQDVTVSVPVDRLSPGVVAVTVNPDGTKEVVRKSVVKDNGIVLTMDGKTTLEIQDNTKVFADTNGHWASDAITFVSSHEIFNGTSDTTFSPNEGITRGMLVKVLHNLEGEPMVNGGGQFSDVASDAWFADPIQWAVDSGIVTGVSSDAFAPNKQITREDIAVMLYRYAGSPQVSNRVLSFRDADQVSSYAETAICWAVENGIMSGTDAVTLDPKGTATRAQASVMLMRMIGTIMG